MTNTSTLKKYPKAITKFSKSRFTIIHSWYSNPTRTLVSYKRYEDLTYLEFVKGIDKIIFENDTNKNIYALDIFVNVKINKKDTWQNLFFKEPFVLISTVINWLNKIQTT